MSKTWQNLLDESRFILKDTEEDRYTDSALLSKLNRGLQELARLRPDAFWDYFQGEDVHVPEVVNLDATPDTDEDEFDEDEDAQIALSATFSIPMMFYTPLVYFVSGSAELIDDEFTEDGRAAMLLSEFRRMVATL